MNPAVDPAGSTKLRSARMVRVDVTLRWLLLIFISGLILVVGTRAFFSNLQEELGQRSANERARLFIGEEIVRGIHGIEKDLYQMAVTANPAGVRLLRASVAQHSEKLRHDLLVLSQGGTVRRRIELNIEGRDQMVREVTFTPAEADGGYVMELIEIAPLLDQILVRVDELERLLNRRWENIEQGNQKRFFEGEEEISIFLKHIPPYFKRLDENANRLYYDSSEKLRRLEAELSVQRERLSRLEMGLLALVLLFSGAGAVLMVRRIRLANDAREQALREARAARDAAERASRTKSDFVSRMSHELRTPLNAIIGFAQLLEAEPLDDSQREYVSLINSSGNHLMELINAVLDHAKIEAGSLTLEQIRYDFPATIRAVCSIVLERASNKGLQFIATIAEDLPRWLIGDPTRLRQILINLLVNAVKFTERGSVELRVAVDDGLLVFSIRDSGIGMDEETLSRLFQPFAQADETITRRYGGTGLGLLISKELVEAMGGAIEVESAVGVGTCFWIRLPLQKAEAGSEEVVQAADEGPADLAALIGGKVLLVDDNRVNQQLGGAMLRRLGLDFDLADNGRHALDCLERAAYALVLMDMEMPEMDGLSATREIRVRERQAGVTKALTIIAMTANALAEHRERCLSAGMDGYVSKPISFAALQGEIRRLFAPEVGIVHSPASDADVPVPPTSRRAAVDRALALERLGDEDLLRELASLFIADLPGNLEALQQAVAAENWADAARLAHTLKGLFGTFAAESAEALARTVEQLATEGSGGEVRQQLPELLVAARDVREDLRRIVGEAA